MLTYYKQHSHFSISTSSYIIKHCKVPKILKKAIYATLTHLFTIFTWSIHVHINVYEKTGCVGSSILASRQVNASVIPPIVSNIITELTFKFFSMLIKLCSLAKQQMQLCNNFLITEWSYLVHGYLEMAPFAPQYNLIISLQCSKSRCTLN
jgi:hypothetical protein